MKTSKSFFFLSMQFLILFFIISNASAQKKTEYKIVKLETSAHTEMCKAKIEKTLAYEKGIVESDLNRNTHILTVKYKPNKTTVDRIIKIITDLGHDAKEIDIEEIKN